MSLHDFAHDSLTTTIKARAVLTLLESMGKVIGRWSGDDLEIEIKKFRERQSNLKSKLIPRPFQDHSKTTQEEKREEEKRIHTPKPPKGAVGFDDFWKEYPRKDAKQSALKAWVRIGVTHEMLPAIMAAVSKHKMKPDWTKDNGQFIPMPSTWLNQRRWEDQGTSIVDPSAPVNMRDHLYARDRDEAKIS